MKVISLLLLAILIVCCSGGKEQSNQEEEKIFTENLPGYYDTKDVDVPAVIVDGIEGIASRMEYPYTAKSTNKGGRIFIKVHIDEYGDIKKTELIKGIGYGCDEIAMKAVKETEFIPAKKDGKSVKSVVFIPIVYKP